MPETAEVPAGTLGLIALTSNAMALIAPGAFLWVTYGLQAASEDGGGNSTAKDMWFGIVFALIVAFSTALPYSVLARYYSEAGNAGAYYFTNMAFKHSLLTKAMRKRARFAKLVTGWAAHLFYWVYPGVMTAFAATLIVWLIELGAGDGEVPGIVTALFAFVFAASVAAVGVKGVSGSTLTSIVINVVQLTMLVFFAILNFVFRATNELEVGTAPAVGKPGTSEWLFPNVGSILHPHSGGGMLFQASIAILILVGFDSATSMGAAAKNARRDIPRAVLLSLFIQGVLAYGLEYFAANCAMSTLFPVKKGVTGSGFLAAGADNAPIGTLAEQVGNSVLGHGAGEPLKIFMAITVLMAVFGSTLAAMVTAVSFSASMAQDNELPSFFGHLHHNWGTPWKGFIVAFLFSGTVGAVGAVGGTVFLTAVTLASNIGTFSLYTMVCIAALIAFYGPESEVKAKLGEDFTKNILTQQLVPIVGTLLNLMMILAILIIGLMSAGDTRIATLISFGITFVWLIISVTYWVLKKPKEDIDHTTSIRVAHTPQDNNDVEKGLGETDPPTSNYDNTEITSGAPEQQQPTNPLVALGGQGNNNQNAVAITEA